MSAAGGRSTDHPARGPRRPDGGFGSNCRRIAGFRTIIPAMTEAQQPYAKWNEIALPLLRYIGENESDSWNKVQSDKELAAAAGLADRVDEVNYEMRRLIDGGYIACRSEPGRLQPGTEYFGQRLTGDGARAINQWPPNDLVTALQSYIDLQINEVESDEDRQRWERLKWAIRDLPSHMIGAMINLAISAAS